MDTREINAAIPFTVFLLVSVMFYGLFDSLSGEDEGSDSEADLEEAVSRIAHLEKEVTEHRDVVKVLRSKWLYRLTLLAIQNAALG